jgi:hypothetical protein
MNLKKRLETIIRGWLPKEPTLPRPQRSGSVAGNTKVPAKPDVTTMFERRFQLNAGIAIGLGIALILIGFLGWFSVSYTYEKLENFFLASGYDPNSYYLFKDLTEWIAIYLALMVTGAVTLLWSALILKSRAVRELFSSMGPHFRLGNGLIGGGGALAFISTRFLFLYILASDYLQLEFFIASFLVGIFLLACGILALRLKR